MEKFWFRISAAVQVRILLCVSFGEFMCAFLSDKYLEMKFLGNRVGTCWALDYVTKQFSKWILLIYIPTTSTRELQLLYVHTHMFCLFFSIFLILVILVVV